MSRSTIFYRTISVVLLGSGLGISGGAAEAFSERLEGFIGIGASNEPVFSGSDDSETSASFEIDLTWDQRLFLSTGVGLGFYVLNAERTGRPLSLGLAVGYDDDERIATDDPRLRGLNDVEAGAAVRAVLEYQIGPAELGILASRGVTGSGHDGMTVEASLGFDLALSERAIITVAPFVIWADGAYNNAFYGISPSEALASEYAVYSAGAGFQQAGIELSAAYLVTERIGLFAQVEYNSLLGDARDSPITFEDDAVELSAGVLLRF